ncbi:hypothetical protein FCV25MIE_28245 [Fagus crenata]
MIFGDPPGHDNLVTRLPLYIHPSSFQSATQTLLDCTLYLSHAIPSACTTPPPPPLSSAIHFCWIGASDLAGMEDIGHGDPMALEAAQATQLARENAAMTTSTSKKRGPPEHNDEDCYGDTIVGDDRGHVTLDHDYDDAVGKSVDVDHCSQQKHQSTVPSFAIEDVHKELTAMKWALKEVRKEVESMRGELTTLLEMVGTMEDIQSMKNEVATLSELLTTMKSDILMEIRKG